MSSRADLGSCDDADRLAIICHELSKRRGPISGRSETELAPRGTANCAQAAAVLHRYLEGLEE